MNLPLLLLLAALASPAAWGQKAKPPAHPSAPAPVTATVSLSVGDLAASQLFYTEHLGFHRVRPTERLAPGVERVVLELDGVWLELRALQKSVAPAVLWPERDNPASLQGVFQFGFPVANLGQLVATLHAKGLKVVRRPTQDPVLGVPTALVQDPDGNLLQLLQRAGK
jgi:catechol 2,3-dioxygenase-like lactoylglutathione lyase family enzyme